MLPHKLKAMMMYDDAQEYQGQTQEITVPKLALKMEEYRSGGMLGPVSVDLGLEALSCEITMGANMVEMTKQFGLCDIEAVPLQLRGSGQADDECSTEAIEIAIRGRWSEIDGGSWKAGEDTTTKYTCQIATYKYISNGKTILDIDLKRMIFIVNGTDLYAAHRANIGLSY
jgi:P2 family phage contractile tail tube protein